MPNHNEHIIIGHAGREPDVREVGDTTVAKFSVATNRRWKDRNGEQQERITWHRVECWGIQAEIARDRIQKGSLVMVSGEVNEDEYTDKDGNTQRSRYIRARVMQPLDKRNEQASEQAAPPPQKSPAPVAASTGGFDDDIPF